MVYRGLSLDDSELNLYRQMLGQPINLSGYSSTSKKRSMAVYFAMKNKDPNRSSVLFEIDLCEGTLSGYCFQLNTHDFTRYPDEQEILLDDGRPYLVDDIVETSEYNSARQKKKLVKIRLKSLLPEKINLEAPGLL